MRWYSRREGISRCLILINHATRPATAHEMRNEVQTSRQKTPVPEGNGRRSQEIKRYPSMVKRGSPAYHRGEERESSWSQRSRPSEESKSIGVGKRSRKAVERNSKWPSRSFPSIAGQALIP